MIPWNNTTTTVPVIRDQVVWTLLKKYRVKSANVIVVDFESYDYQQALAVSINRRRKEKGTATFKLMSREVGKKIDITSKAVQANFK
jgi:hypothetical protein